MIGGNVGGIRYQIESGVNGFLVSSVEEAAECIVRLLKDEKLREEIGQKAREMCAKNFCSLVMLNNISISSPPSMRTFICKNKSDVRDRSGQRREITLLLS